MSQSIRQEKFALRKKIKAALAQIEAVDAETQSRRVTEKVLELPAYQNAEAISIFLSMPGREVSTMDIVLDALRQNKKVFIPYIYPSVDDPKSKTMEMLQLRDEEDLQTLKPDAWGIPSLSANDIMHRENALGGHGITVENSLGRPSVSLVFVPGMAFDRSNNRLGHGKGFYDKYLSRMQHNASETNSLALRPNLVGLALREQILADGEVVPTDKHDWRIDQVVTAD